MIRPAAGPLGPIPGQNEAEWVQEAFKVSSGVKVQHVTNDATRRKDISGCSGLGSLNGHLIYINICIHHDYIQISMIMWRTERRTYINRYICIYIYYMFIYIYKHKRCMYAYSGCPWNPSRVRMGTYASMCLHYASSWQYLTHVVQECILSICMQCPNRAINWFSGKQLVQI